MLYTPIFSEIAADSNAFAIPLRSSAWHSVLLEHEEDEHLDFACHMLGGFNQSRSHWGPSSRVEIEIRNMFATGTG